MLKNRVWHYRGVVFRRPDLMVYSFIAQLVIVSVIVVLLTVFLSAVTMWWIFLIYFSFFAFFIWLGLRKASRDQLMNGSVRFIVNARLLNKGNPEIPTCAIPDCDDVPFALESEAGGYCHTHYVLKEGL